MAQWLVKKLSKLMGISVRTLHLGIDGKKWAIKYGEYTLSMRPLLVQHRAMFSEMGHIVEQIIGDTQKASLADRVRFDAIMQEAVLKVAKQYNVSIPVYPQMTPEMQAWMQAALSANMSN